MPVKTADARNALAGIIREQVKLAAGTDGKVSRKDEAKLDPFIQEAVESVRKAKPGRSPKVNDVVDRAMTSAMDAWARFDPPGHGRDSLYLSKAEVKAMERGMPELGRLTRAALEIAQKKAPQDATPPVVKLVNAPPGVTVAQQGDVFTFKALTSVAPGTPVTVDVDGIAVQITRAPRGFQVNALTTGLPEAYGAVVLSTQDLADGSETAVRLVKTPATWLSKDDARTKTSDALVQHIKTQRMGDADWGNYFPTTWENNVTRGIVAGITRFADPTNPDVEVMREPDKYIFTGRGPYDLYTEVEVSRKNGAILRAMIEID